MLEIIRNPSLKERTTLHLGGTAIAELLVRSSEDALALPEALHREGGTAFVLGAGSNLLAQDGALPLTLVSCRCTDAPEVVGEIDGKVLVRVGGGVGMPRLLARCMLWGLSGLEGLSGIPGSVGGAVAMNAGSYGCSTAQLLHEIHIYTPSHGLRVIPASELEFTYRHLGVKNLCEWFLLLHATFALTREARNGINERMHRNFFKKKSTQPIHAWSAGCAFKNPAAEMSAGMMLEQAGFKGKKMGGMVFSAMHANFLVNEGTGTSTAALDLMAMAQEAVRARFGVTLEPEVRILPWPPR